LNYNLKNNFFILQPEASCSRFQTKIWEIVKYSCFVFFLSFSTIHTWPQLLRHTGAQEPFQLKQILLFSILLLILIWKYWKWRIHIIAVCLNVERMFLNLSLKRVKKIIVKRLKNFSKEKDTFITLKWGCFFSKYFSGKTQTLFSAKIVSYY
jgi:hypothetical protein